MEVIDVHTGDVKVCKGEEILQVSAIGSCVVVAAVDSAAGVGGMAHVMLPGACPDGQPSRRLRYANDAIEEMARMMKELGADATRIEACLVGGGDVLGKADTLGEEVAGSVAGALARTGIRLVAMELGGTQRRSCTLDVRHGRVTYTVGDSAKRTLWEAAGRRGVDGVSKEETT